MHPKVKRIGRVKKTLNENAKDWFILITGFLISHVVAEGVHIASNAVTGRAFEAILYRDATQRWNVDCRDNYVWIGADGKVVGKCFEYL
jgi:hypothetical protein